MFFALELLFSSVGDVQYSECIFKINAASLSIFKANMGRNSTELFRIKVMLQCLCFLCVIVNAVSSFVSLVVTITLGVPDVQMSKCHKMPPQGCISFYSFSYLFSPIKKGQTKAEQ